MKVKVNLSGFTLALILFVCAKPFIDIYGTTPFLMSGLTVIALTALIDWIL